MPVKIVYYIACVFFYCILDYTETTLCHYCVAYIYMFQQTGEYESSVFALGKRSFTVCRILAVESFSF